MNIEFQEDLSVQENCESLLNLLVQTIHLLEGQESMEFLKFFNHVLNFLNQYGSNIGPLEKLKVEFMMNVMNSLLQDNQYDLLNYLLNQIAEQKLINIQFLSDEQFYVMAKIYFQFALYLKSFPNYGNQKESFLNFLNHSLFLLEQIRVKNFQVNNKIVENLLNKGIFFMNQKAYSTADENLKQAYALTVTHLSSKTLTVLLFTLLYNIGLCSYQLRMFEEGLYYLE